MWECPAIQYWLFKSEPDAWSWDQQKKEGAKGAEWDGVRNYQARNVMRADEDAAISASSITQARSGASSA